MKYHTENSATKIIRAAGMGFEEEFLHPGAAKFKTPHVSKGDSVFKPLSIRPRDTDWPTPVIESG